MPEVVLASGVLVCYGPSRWRAASHADAWVLCNTATGQCVYLCVMSEVTKCFARCGFKACPHEIRLDGPCMDILSPAGLLACFW